MCKDNQKDRDKTVEFLKEQSLYHSMLSTKTMQDYHTVYHKTVESKQLTIAELREQYNNVKFKTGLSYSWQDWLACATINGLIKE
jgi:hypothetical protein